MTEHANLQIINFWQIETKYWVQKLNSSEGIVSKANEDVFYKLEVREVTSRSNLSYFESCPAAGYARPEEHPLFSWFDDLWGKQGALTVNDCLKNIVIAKFIANGYGSLKGK